MWPGSLVSDGGECVFVSGLAHVPRELRRELVGVQAALPGWGMYAWVRAEGALVPEWVVRRVLGLVEKDLAAAAVGDGDAGGGLEVVYEALLRTQKTCRGVVGVLVEGQEVGPVRARTLVVMGTKGGLVPTGDNVDTAREVAEVLKRGNVESRAVQHRGMRHPWNEQDPKLFAEAVMAWLERSTLPEGVEDI